jgi:hypothetical protein
MIRLLICQRSFSYAPFPHPESLWQYSSNSPSRGERSGYLSLPIGSMAKAVCTRASHDLADSDLVCGLVKLVAGLPSLPPQQDDGLTPTSHFASHTIQTGHVRTKYCNTHILIHQDMLKLAIANYTYECNYLTLSANPHHTIQDLEAFRDLPVSL